MPITIQRRSARALEQAKKVNDICLSSDQTFIFFFEVDRSYMLFAAIDKDWPAMLNTEKVSLKRNSIVEFPRIGSGKFVTYGPHELMLKVGGYMTEKIDDPDFDVKDLDITKVIQEVISEERSDKSDDKHNAVDDSFSESESDEPVGKSSQAAPSRKRRRQESGDTENADSEDKCSKCGRSDGEKAALKQLAYEKLLHLALRLEQRLDRSNQIQKENLVLVRKVMKEVTEAKDTAHARVDVVDDEEKEHLFFEGKCLTNKGGDTAEEKVKRVARTLWTKEDLAKHVIDPHKQLKPEQTGRTRIDEAREIEFKKAVKVVLGKEYSKKVYRRTVRLVNVMGNGYKNKGFKENSDSDE